MKNAAQETRTASQSISGRFIAYREYIIVVEQQKINHGTRSYLGCRHFNVTVTIPDRQTQ